MSQAVTRVRSEGGMVRASEVLPAVEIVSPSSKRMDHVHKRNDRTDVPFPVAVNLDRLV